MVVLYSLLGLIGLLILLYLLVFLRPRGRKPKDSRLLCDYAHRGLHGNGVPENSLLAFEEAVKKGFGIELDVQLSADGVVMVFHDYTLIRMTGKEEKLKNLTAAELQALSLAGTEQTIPTFREVLELVDGKVPLLVELKGEDLNSALCPKVAELLQSYQGPYCVESFNPLLVKNIKKYLPHVYCGQLYTNVCRDKKKYSPLNLILSAMAFNFLARPDFIAYNLKDRKAFPVLVATKLYKAPRFVWTVRTEEDLETAHRLGEHPIFEK
jgi:glycerophosphoryl diester phosphodiesterase